MQDELIQTVKMKKYHKLLEKHVNELTEGLQSLNQSTGMITAFERAT